jgi:hypothetical protein
VGATPIFDDLLSVETLAVTSGPGRRSTAPNFLRMDRMAALDCARRGGNNVLVQGDEGRVVAQVPAPGAAMERNGVIRLMVSGGVSGRARAGMETNTRSRAAYRAVAVSQQGDGANDGLSAIARTMAIAGQAAVATAMVGR